MGLSPSGGDGAGQVLGEPRGFPFWRQVSNQVWTLTHSGAAADRDLMGSDEPG